MFRIKQRRELVHLEVVDIADHISFHSVRVMPEKVCSLVQLSLLRAPTRNFEQI